MKTYGIISEYNPFHNGHAYQIEETRKHGATHIVAVMSGNYVQRGDVAMIDKFARAKAAVEGGVDLVIEMPTAYSLASAGYFAKAGITILGALGCVDGISFGSECGDADLLKNAAAASLNMSAKENVELKVKPFLQQGMSFQTAMQQAIALENGPMIAGVFDSPNNTLAVEYLKAMKLLNLDLEIFTVKRKGASHDSMEPSDGFASGSLIREMIEDGEDISPFVPKHVAELVKEYEEKEQLAYFDNLERELLYILRSSIPPTIAECPDVDPGMANFIFRAGIDSDSIDEFLEKATNKKITTSRVRRMLLCLYTGVKASDLMLKPPYGRVLALNEKGAEILKAAKEKKEQEESSGKYVIPFGTSLKEFVDLNVPPISRFADITNRSTNLYGLASRTVRPCAQDFTVKVEVQ